MVANFWPRRRFHPLLFFTFFFCLFTHAQSPVSHFRDLDAHMHPVAASSPEFHTPWPPASEPRVQPIEQLCANQLAPPLHIRPPRSAARASIMMLMHPPSRASRTGPAIVAISTVLHILSKTLFLILFCICFPAHGVFATFLLAHAVVTLTRRPMPSKAHPRARASAATLLSRGRRPWKFRRRKSTFRSILSFLRFAKLAAHPRNWCRAPLILRELFIRTSLHVRSRLWLFTYRVLYHFLVVVPTRLHPLHFYSVYLYYIFSYSILVLRFSVVSFIYRLPYQCRSFLHCLCDYVRVLPIITPTIVHTTLKSISPLDFPILCFELTRSYAYCCTRICTLTLRRVRMSSPPGGGGVPAVPPPAAPAQAQTVTVEVNDKKQYSLGVKASTRKDDNFAKAKTLLEMAWARPVGAPWPQTALRDVVGESPATAQEDFAVFQALFEMMEGELLKELNPIIAAPGFYANMPGRKLYNMLFHPAIEGTDRSTDSIDKGIAFVRGSARRPNGNGAVFVTETQQAEAEYRATDPNLYRAPLPDETAVQLQAKIQDDIAAIIFIDGVRNEQLRSRMLQKKQMEEESVAATHGAGCAAFLKGHARGHQNVDAPPIDRADAIAENNTPVDGTPAVTAAVQALLSPPNDFGKRPRRGAKRTDSKPRPCPNFHNPNPGVGCTKGDDCELDHDQDRRRAMLWAFKQGTLAASGVAPSTALAASAQQQQQQQRPQQQQQPPQQQQQPAPHVAPQQPPYAVQHPVYAPPQQPPQQPLHPVPPPPGFYAHPPPPGYYGAPPPGAAAYMSFAQRCDAAGGFAHATQPRPGPRPPAGPPPPAAAPDEADREARSLLSHPPTHLTDPHVWIFDSGCSDHMSPFHSDFIFLDRAFTQPINGINSEHPIHAAGRGTISCIANSARFTAPKSLFVPELPFRLFSATRALDKGAHISLFKPRPDRRCGTISIPTCPDIPLYFVNNLIVFSGTFGPFPANSAPPSAAFLAPQQSPQTAASPPESLPFFDSLSHTALLHHLRNNHRGHEIDKNTLSVTSGGPSLPRSSKSQFDSCTACTTAKSSHKPVPHSRRSKATRPATRRLVYTDWFGPVSTPGRSGERWVQAFIDDDSNFVGAYVCRSKDQGAANLRAFTAALSELTHGECAVTVVQADYERVFTDGAFATECSRQGISQRFSAPYSHAQNGRIERFWRTMEVQVSAMMTYSQLPPSFWPYALRAFVHSYNRQSDSNGSDTPIERLTLMRPSIEHFRVWGCPVLVHLEKSQHAKFASKCIPAINLGPNLTTKDGYYVYVPSTRQIRTSRHLEFDELARARSEYYQSAMLKFNAPPVHFSTPRPAEPSAPSPSPVSAPPTPPPPLQLSVSLPMASPPPATPQVGLPHPPDAASVPRPLQVAGSATAPARVPRRPPPHSRARALDPIFEHAQAPAGILEFNDDDPIDHPESRSPTPALFDISPPHSPPSSPAPSFASPASDLSSPVPSIDSPVSAPAPPARPARNRRPPGEWYKVQSTPTGTEPSTFYATIAPATALFSYFSCPPTPHSPVPLTLSHASTLPFAYYSTLLQFSSTHEAYCFANVVLPTGATPRTHDQALASVDRRHWRFALDSEYEQLVDAQTWELVPRSEAPNVISGKWVFKIKKNSDGSIDRYKARWVARGFSQKHDIDYTEIFAPVIRYSSVRLLLSLANIHDLDLYGCDVSNAFARSDVDQALYVRQPTGFEKNSPSGVPLVCKLIKGLYGTKQAARLWHRKLRSHLIADGWSQFESDPGIYFRRHPIYGRQYLGVYVDDLVHACSSPQAQHAFLEFCNSHFPTTSQGPLTWILGMEVKRDRKNKILSINQTQAISEFLETNNIIDPPFTATPMEAHWSYGEAPPTTDPKLIQMYRSQVASLNFYSQCTRPDLAFPVSALSRHLATPNESCFHALTRTLNYLHTTSNLGIVYHPTDNTTLSLETYADASFGSESINKAKSPQGYLIYFAGGLVDWKANLQSTVALSTAEAEHISAFSASRAIVYYRQLLEEFGHTQSDPTVLWEDNEACIAQSKNPVNHKRNLHMLVKYHYLRDLTESNIVRLQYIRTHSQLADILTKPLSPTQFTTILPHLVRPV